LDIYTVIIFFIDINTVEKITMYSHDIHIITFSMQYTVLMSPLLLH